MWMKINSDVYCDKSRKIAYVRGEMLKAIKVELDPEFISGIKVQLSNKDWVGSLCLDKIQKPTKLEFVLRLVGEKNINEKIKKHLNKFWSYPDTTTPSEIENLQQVIIIIEDEENDSFGKTYGMTIRKFIRVFKQHPNELGFK